jgi:hypothetical protein
MAAESITSLWGPRTVTAKTNMPPERQALATEAHDAHHVTLISSLRFWEPGMTILSSAAGVFR